MKSWRVLAAACALALSVAGCASAPEPVGPVSCALLSSREVSYLSTESRNNPFVPITGLLRGTDEFVVLKVSLSLSQASQVILEGSVQAEDGSEVARLQTLPQMIRYWQDEDEVPHRDVVARGNTLTRWYPPSPSFEAKQGRSEYIVVFKGKKPIPRPATVSLALTLGDGTSQEFTFSLPPKT